MTGAKLGGHVVMWSHGLGSRTAATRVKAVHGIADLWCVITETFSERADAYRFGVEALFHLYDQPCPPELVEMARAIPPFRPGTAEERATSVEARKAAVRALANEVMALLPKVVWTWEGRTPWEVAKEWGQGMLPSSRVPICSIVIKAEHGDAILGAMFDPARTTIHFGLDWSEPHRLEKVRAKKSGWNVSAPLSEPPYLEKEDMAALAQADGLTPSVAYRDGHSHDNCGGACFKGGHAAWALLHATDQSLFLFNAQEEGDFRAERGPYAILKDRRGGKTTPMPLPVLASRIPSGLFDQHDHGGCGCFVDDFGGATAAVGASDE